MHRYYTDPTNEERLAATLESPGPERLFSSQMKREQILLFDPGQNADDRYLFTKLKPVRHRATNNKNGEASVDRIQCTVFLAVRVQKGM